MITKVKIAILILVSFMPLQIVNASEDKLSEEYQLDLHKAKVIEVIDEIKHKDTIVQVLEIKLLNKAHKGTITKINNTLTGSDYDIELSEGDKISVICEEVDGEISFYFHSYDKTFYLSILAIIFIISVIIFGGFKGFKALIALIVTFALIIFCLVPLLLKGYNPIILSISVCILSTILTFAITNGFTKKTLIAILGVVGGLLIGGLIAYVFGVLLKISGFSSESAQMLQYLPSGVAFDFKGLLFAGIIIGALGACMDVAMELTSSLIEIKKHKPNICIKELIISGFNIGKDIMGTMVNTLILAYTGGSLSTILLFVGFERSMNEIINLESITSEIIRAISGSLGLLFAIPCTIFAFAYIYDKGRKKHEENI